jgi:hypothetical protein
MSAKEKLRHWGRNAAIGVGLLWVANLVADSPDHGKAATKDTAGQVGGLAVVTKNLGGAAYTGVAEHNPFHLTLTDPLETATTAAETPAAGGAETGSNLVYVTPGGLACGTEVKRLIVHTDDSPISLASDAGVANPNSYRAIGGVVHPDQTAVVC